MLAWQHSGCSHLWIVCSATIPGADDMHLRGGGLSVSLKVALRGAPELRHPINAMVSNTIGSWSMLGRVLMADPWDLMPEYDESWLRYTSH